MEAYEINDTIEDYHADRKYVSKTGISKFSDRPSSYWKTYLAPPEFREPFKKSKSLRMGEACHVKAQEPKVWDECYLVAPFKTRTGKEFKEIVRENPDRTVLSLVEYDQICRMTEALWSNRYIRSYLEMSGDVEKSFYYRDPVTGILLKARPDKVSLDSRYVIDIKTTQNIAEFSFRKDCDDFKYWFSPQIIFDGVEAVRAIRPDAYIFLLVENQGEKKPDTDIFFADPEFIEMGRRKLAIMLEKLKKCREANHWPSSHNVKPKPVGLMPYRFIELERLRELDQNIEEISYVG